MRDLALQAAGVLAILVAIAHGAIAELRVFPKARIEPRTRHLLRGVWQASTVDWIGMGVLLIAAPAFGSQAARQWVIAVAVVVSDRIGKCARCASAQCDVTRCSAARIQAMKPIYQRVPNREGHIPAHVR
jgi:hypothetical protein